MRLTNFTPTSLLALLLCLTPVIAQSEGHGGGGGGKDAAAAYPGYLELKPPLVVNLANERRAKYLRIDLQFYLETSHDAELVTQHMPLLRDRMINLLGGRQADQIASAEAREQLRAELLAKLRETMTEKVGVAAIDAIYFTGFIIQ
jgi:flagellar FliL protein